MAKITALGGICLMSLMSFSAHAIMITSDSATSTEGLGAFEANFTWDGSALNLSLTNTSPAWNGGYITGILLNLPNDVTFASATTDSNMTPMLPAGGPYAASPFGSLDYGFALGGNFLGGGKPSPGIAIGETANFTFSDWSGFPAGYESWTSDDMEFYLLDNIHTPFEGDASFWARFRGFENGGSDKVPGLLEPDDDIPPPSIVVPEPGSLLLWLTGIFGLFIHRRRKTR